MTDKPYLVEMKSGAHCMCRFERRPDFDVSGKPPKQLDTCGFHAEQARDATALIEEQRAAIDALVQVLRDIKSTLVVEEWLRPSYGWKEYVTELLDPLLAKHAPA